MSKDSSKGKSVQQVVSQFFSIGSKPSPQSFPELPECIMWVRGFIAILYGLYLGTTDTMGAVNLLFGLNVVAFIPILYCQFLLNADGEMWQNKLVFVGVPNAAGLMLLVWIFVYSQTHADEEAQFMSKMVLYEVSKRQDPPDYFDDATAAGMKQQVIMEDAAAPPVPEPPAVEEATIPEEESEF